MPDNLIPKCPFEPALDLIAVMEVEPRQVGLIALPQTAAKEYLEGLVVAVGSGRYFPFGDNHNEPIEDNIKLVVGDHILYHVGRGVKIVVGYDKFTVLHRGEILGRLIPEGK